MPQQQQKELDINYGLDLSKVYAQPKKFRRAPSFEPGGHSPDNNESAANAMFHHANSVRRPPNGRQRQYAM